MIAGKIDKIFEKKTPRWLLFHNPNSNCHCGRRKQFSQTLHLECNIVVSIDSHSLVIGLKGRSNKTPTPTGGECRIANGDNGRMKVNEPWYCWWFRNPANQLRLEVFCHYLQGFSTIPGGCLGFLNHQQVCFDQIPVGQIQPMLCQKLQVFVAQRWHGEARCHRDEKLQPKGRIGW